MSKTTIITDTISCIPANLVKKYNIQIVPVGLVIDKKLYLDNRLTNAEFWKLFNASKEPVTTNAANPSDFEAAFLQLAEDTENICCILVSKKLSATYNAAVAAKEVIIRKYPSLNIEVIDSQTAAGGEGFVVLEAAQAAYSGQSLSEVVAAIRNMIPRVKLLCTLNTLKYLIRSGRAPKSARIGNWLQIKPILGMVSGTGLVENLGRERGIDKAMYKMVEMVEDYVTAGQPLHVMAHYTDGIASGEKIRDLMLSKYSCCEILLTPYTPVMASQTGPLAAVSFYS
jgi:DegV family protein with EDD domain